MDTGKVFGTIGNLIITVAWFWVFSTLGWISFNNIEGVPVWQMWVLSTLIVWLIGTILGWVYYTFIVATLYIGCITLPVYALAKGWIVLYFTSYLTHWFTINQPFFWFGLLMSIAFGLISIPYSTKKKVSTNDDNEVIVRKS